MNVTPDAVTPPYTTPGPIGDPAGSHGYLFVVGFFCTALFLVTITYACKDSPSPPTPPATAYDVEYTDRFSHGLEDDVVITFPTFVYSETTPDKLDIATDENGSNCSICLEDYKLADVIRLFPECGHLFHVKCIDTWLKAQPTCPVCRNFAGFNLAS